MYEKQIRLVSDGTLQGTHLYHLPSGTELAFTKLSFEISVDRWGKDELAMTLTMPRIMAELDITGVAEVVPEEMKPVPAGWLALSPDGGWVAAGNEGA